MKLVIHRELSTLYSIFKNNFFILGSQNDQSPSMRQFLLLTCIVPMLLFSQKKTSEKIDSVGYYLELVKFNKNNNNYRNSLEYSQKALDYANKTNNQKSIADSYSNLGTIYLELKKYDDAIDVLIKSIAVYSTLPISSQQALTHYSLGVCYMEKNNFERAENNFDAAGNHLFQN